MLPASVITPSPPPSSPISTPLIPKKSSTLSPPSPPPNLKETSAEAKPFQDNAPLKTNVKRLVDNDNNKNTELKEKPKEEPKRVVSFIKEKQLHKQERPSRKKEIEKKQDPQASNKNKDRIIPIEEKPSDQQAHALTDANAADQVNKFSQERHKSKEAAYKKTPSLHPEHIQEYLLSPSPIGWTNPAAKSTEQTQSGQPGRVSKTHNSMVAMGKGNQEESKRHSEHTVIINIGHIEVRAITPQKSSSVKMQPSSQTLSLRDYLKKRSQGTLQ